MCAGCALDWTEPLLSGFSGLLQALYCLPWEEFWLTALPGEGDTSACDYGYALGD